MPGFLTKEQVSLLKQAHREIKDKRLADRVKAVLSLNSGFEYAQVAEILLLDETTLRRYVQKFQDQGLPGLVENHYLGSQSRLTTVQLPPYSPNLNPIERLWKLYHTKITNNQYFENFKDFKIQTLEFFKNLKQYRQELNSLLTDNFQTLPDLNLQS